MPGSGLLTTQKEGTFLDLQGNRKVSDVGITALAAGCAKLESLNLTNCDIVTTKGIAPLAACASLRALSLSGLDEVFWVTEDDHCASPR